MDPEDKSTLKRVLELEQKNNKMLTSIRKSMLWGNFFRVIYWIVIIGTAIGAYYYIQPYVDGITDAYGTFSEDIDKFKNLFQNN